jgi:hypothetical protein
VNPSTPLLRPVMLAALATLACLSSVAFAGEDNNFSRDSANRQGETINTTGLRFAFDKGYGRQNYSLAARLNKVQYAHYGNSLNNDGKDLTASVSSGLGANWLVSAGGSYSQNLNPIQDNLVGSARLVRNIKTSHDGNLAVQYGNGGRWALIGSYDANKLSYSQAAYKYQDADQHSTGLRAVYYSSDVLNFGLGARSVSTHYPLNLNNETIKDKNIDLSASWQLTGLSNLDAYLSRRNSSYATDSNRHIKGWTGALNWQYTPHGLLSYGVNATRTTGNDRSVVDTGLFNAQSLLPITKATAYNNVTTSYNLSAQLQATGKLSFGLTHGVTQYRIDNSTDYANLNGLNANASTSSVNHNTRLSASYAIMRNVGAGCYVAQYSQTADPNQGRVKFDGRVYGCNASFTLD